MMQKNEPELDSLMSQYINILAKQKALKENKEDIKSKILIYLKINDIQKYQSPDNIILTFKTSNRTTINRALVEDYCENNNVAFDIFQKKAEVERLIIKKIEGED